jgi:hypothetical protein
MRYRGSDVDFDMGYPLALKPHAVGYVACMSNMAGATSFMFIYPAPPDNHHEHVSDVTQHNE